MKVYLDNSATTRPRDEVIEEMLYVLKEAYGNPSSLHRMGLEVEKKIVKARETIANFLGVKSEEIFFTSGGTESNNIAVQGIIEKYKRQGNHIITTKIEHPSVMDVFKRYEEKGFKVTYLDVDEQGFIDLEELKSSITEETILLSVMLVNNEIGTIQNFEGIKRVLKEKNDKVKLHVDGVQAFGKIAVDIKKMGIDTFSLSGHKIHGPKGIGCLYVKKGVRIEPRVYGGNQEKGLRSGTENVPGIVGLGKAVEILSNNFNEEKKRINELKDYFIGKINDRIGNVKINSPIEDKCAPHILNISFLGTRGEVLLHYLEKKQIFVSTGSACSSNKKGKSKVLKAIGLSDEEIEGTIRFSFAFSNTKEEIDYVIDKLIESVDEIRKIMMR